MRSKNSVFVALLLLGIGLLIGLGVGMKLAGPLAQLPAPAPTIPQDAGQEATARKSVQALRQLQSRLAAIEQSLTGLTNTLVRTPPRVASTDGLCTAVLPDEGVLRQEVTQLLREELREVLTRVNTGQDRTHALEVEPTTVLQTAENRQAYDTASDVVLGAVSAGRWTDDDAQALRSAWTHLTGAQLEEVLQMLIPAINREEIAVETAGPLF